MHFYLVAQMCVPGSHNGTGTVLGQVRLNLSVSHVYLIIEVVGDFVGTFKATGESFMLVDPQTSPTIVCIRCGKNSKIDLYIYKVSQTILSSEVWTQSYQGKTINKKSQFG